MNGARNSPSASRKTFFLTGHSIGEIGNGLSGAGASTEGNRALGACIEYVLRRGSPSQNDERADRAWLGYQRSGAFQNLLWTKFERWIRWRWRAAIAAMCCLCMARRTSWCRWTWPISIRMCHGDKMQLELIEGSNHQFSSLMWKQRVYDLTTTFLRRQIEG